MKKVFMVICMLLVVVLLISLVRLLSPSVRDNEHSNKTPVSGGNNSSGGNNLPGGNIGDVEEGEPVYETSCPYCDAVYDTREHSACPNEDCPSHEEDDETGDAPGSEFEKCPLCGIGILGEGSGECTNPDCTSNGGNVGLVVCPDCGQSYNADTEQSCPNTDCPSHSSTGEGWSNCPHCGAVVGEASDCPNGCDDLCPICSSSSYGPNGGVCLNCDGKCSVCSDGYIQKSDGKCSNSACSSNSSGGGDNVQYCPTCGASMGEASNCPNGCDDLCPICSSSSYGWNDGLCMECDGECSVCSDGYIQKIDGKCSNAACSSNSSGGDYNYGTCDICGASLQEGGTCSNEECSSKMPNDSFTTPEGWLFKDAYINGTGSGDLPVPVSGESYTLFVDGEEIGTDTALDNSGFMSLNFYTSDYRIWFKYETGNGWHFHPMDSQVQSGTVSIRINGSGSSGSGNVQYCPTCGASMGEASDCPNGCDDPCPICGSSSYGWNGGLCLDCDGECSVCSDGYIQKSDGKCSNAACSSNSSGGDYNYGTCGTCGASLQEGGTCSNEECPTKQ